MVFVQSLRGLSHTKLEDTKEEHLELAVQALDRLASKTIERVRGRLEEAHQRRAGEDEHHPADAAGADLFRLEANPAEMIDDDGGE